MADVSHKIATYADIEALPEHLVVEILFGHLITHPRPERRHGDKNWLLTHTFQDDEAGNAPPFDALTFSLGLLWPFDPPS